MTEVTPPVCLDAGKAAGGMRLSTRITAGTLADSWNVTLAIAPGVSAAVVAAAAVMATVVAMGVTAFPVTTARMAMAAVPAACVSAACVSATCWFAFGNGHICQNQRRRDESRQGEIKRLHERFLQKLNLGTL
jgi:hypothetical protein